MINLSGALQGQNDDLVQFVHTFIVLRGILEGREYSRKEERGREVTDRNHASILGNRW